MIHQSFALARFHDRVEATVTGEWSGELEGLIRSGEVDRIVLNYALGFAESDLDFLWGLPLRQLVVVDRRLKSLEPINSLGETLELLSVTTDPSLTVDLSALPRLADLSADWEQVRETISTGSALESFATRRYAEADLQQLGNLEPLRRLVLVDRPRVTSLTGLGALPGLRSLTVAYAKSLTDVQSLRDCPLLEELDLEGTRGFPSIAPLSHNRSLRYVNLSECGDLASLIPIETVDTLESVYLYGATKIVDGDLRPLMGLLRLHDLRIQSRRHYSPSVGEVQAAIAARRDSGS